MTKESKHTWFVGVKYRTILDYNLALTKTIINTKKRETRQRVIMRQGERSTKNNRTTGTTRHQ